MPPAGQKSLLQSSAVPAHLKLRNEQKPCILLIVFLSIKAEAQIYDLNTSFASTYLAFLVTRVLLVFFLL